MWHVSIVEVKMKVEDRFIAQVGWSSVDGKPMQGSNGGHVEVATKPGEWTMINQLAVEAAWIAVSYGSH